MKKAVFLSVWSILVLFSLVSVYINSFPLLVKNNVIYINLLQRILGLMAFGLMFFQIVLGSFMPFWRKQLGSLALKFHIFNGVFTYTMIFFHTFMMVVMNYLLGKGFNPFYVYTDVCLLCGGDNEWYVNLGRIAFWLLTVSILAAYFRGTSKIYRLYWRKIHIVNYVIFLIVGLHSLGIGTDIQYLLYTTVVGLLLIMVLGISVYKLINFIKTKGKIDIRL